MKGAYVILTHSYSPVKDGPKKGNMQVHETCEFVDAIKNRHNSYATVIMDVQNRRLLKNRAKEQGATFEDMEQHMINGYSKQYATFLEIVGVDLPEALTKKDEEQEVVKADGKKATKKKATKKKATKKETE